MSDTDFSQLGLEATDTTGVIRGTIGSPPSASFCAASTNVREYCVVNFPSCRQKIGIGKTFFSPPDSSPCRLRQ